MCIRDRPALVEPKNIQLMEEFGVLTKVEMESRYEVEMEHYSKIINIAVSYTHLCAVHPPGGRAVDAGAGAGAGTFRPCGGGLSPG